jgi:hypothetical protein
LSPAGWIVVGLILLAVVAVVALELRDRRRAKAAESAWEERAGANDGRADAAEAVADKVAGDALERQRKLEKRIKDEDERRLADPDPRARRRVQAGWKRADDSSGADVPADSGDPLPDPAAGGSGAGTAGNP